MFTHTRHHRGTTVSRSTNNTAKILLRGETDRTTKINQSRAVREHTMSTWGIINLTYCFFLSLSVIVCVGCVVHTVLIDLSIPISLFSTRNSSNPPPPRLLNHIFPPFHSHSSFPPLSLPPSLPLPPLCQSVPCAACHPA